MVTIWGGVIGFVVLALGLFGVWKSIGACTDRLGARTERVKTRLGDRIGRVEKRLMDAFYQALEEPDIGPISRQSPLQLNELGEAVSAEVGGAEWAERVSATLADWIEGKDAYEIQEHCFEVAENFSYTPEEKRGIHQSAFNLGLPAEQVRRVLAIELRNELLKLARLDAGAGGLRATASR